LDEIKALVRWIDEDSMFESVCALAQFMHVHLRVHFALILGQLPGRVALALHQIPNYDEKITL
jgi:hypothetical protein